MRPRSMASILVPLALLGACGDDGERTLTVFAAASLAEAFGDLEAAFEAEHGSVDVVVNLAGSSALREQLLAGAPADVFASASEADLQAVAPGAGQVFATNDLVVAVPAGNPGGVTGLADVGRGELLVGLCAPQVPCGTYAAAALEAAGISAEPDTEEPDVRGVLAKLADGELDVGIVYRTDALAAGDAVEVVGPPLDVAATYAIAALTADGRALVDLVLGADGQALLAARGFGPP